MRDRDFALNSVGQYPNTLLFVSDDVRNDETFLLEAIQRNAEVLRFVDSKTSTRICNIALNASIKQNSQTLEKIQQIVSKTINREEDQNLIKMFSRIPGHPDLESANDIRQWMNQNQELLSHITQFDLADLQLTQIPIELGFLKNLQYLMLSHNQIQSLEHFPLLPNLEMLFINNNQIQSLEHFPLLPRLETLDMNNNQIQSLEHFPLLPRLKWLYMNNNQIQSLEHFPLLPSLNTLDMKDNHLTNVDAFLHLSAFCEIDVTNNPFPPGYAYQYSERREQEFAVDPRHYSIVKFSTQGVLTPDQILNSELALYIDGRKIHVHPLIIQHHPEKVLKVLADWLQNHNDFPSIDFLTDSLSEGAGIDAGGLRRQFFFELFKNLFDGSETRIIKNQGGIPYGDQEVFQDIGIVLAKCLLHNQNPGEPNQEFIGRVLPSQFYPFLVDVIKEEAYRNFTSEKIIAICVSILPQSTLNHLLEITTDQIDQLYGMYRPCVESALHIVDGMKMAMTPEQLHSLQPEEIQHLLQGNFNREDIAKRVTSTNHNRVILRKVKWLQEFIQDPRNSDEWIQKLLVAITGRDVMAADQNLNVVSSDEDTLCTFHTCFNQIVVSDVQGNAGVTADLLDQYRDRGYSEEKLNFFCNLVKSIELAGAEFQLA